MTTHYCTSHKTWYDDYCTRCFEEKEPGWDFYINPKQEEVDQQFLDDKEPTKCICAHAADRQLKKQTPER